MVHVNITLKRLKLNKSEEIVDALEAIVKQITYLPPVINIVYQGALQLASRSFFYFYFYYVQVGFVVKRVSLYFMLLTESFVKSKLIFRTFLFIIEKFIIFAQNYNIYG